AASRYARSLTPETLSPTYPQEPDGCPVGFGRQSHLGRERRPVGSNGTPGVEERPAGSAGATRPAKRRLLVGAAVVLGTTLLTGCSSATTDQWKRLGLPEGASDRTEAIRSLWIGAWTAALIVGVMVWGL